MVSKVERFPVRTACGPVAGQRRRAPVRFSWAGMLAALVTGGLLGYSVALTMLR